MMISRRSPQIELAFVRLRARLAATNSGVPTALFIPVGFIALLLLFVSLETNQRIRSTATPLVLDGEQVHGAALWFSIAPQKDGLSISGTDGEAFFIDTHRSDFTEFETHLLAKRKKIISEVTLANRMTMNSSFVVLAVDEQLTYAHIRPIVYALARAGVTRYGFEGRIFEQ